MNISKFYLMLSLLLLLYIGTFQIASADPPGDDNIEDPDIPLPIDAGCSLLLMAGAVYGWRKIKNSKNKN